MDFRFDPPCPLDKGGADRRGEKPSPSWKASDRILWSLYFSLRKLNQVHGKNVTSEQQSDKITARLQGIVHHSLVDIQTVIAL
jgi:hypothetical protein